MTVDSRTVAKAGFSTSKKARILMLALAPVAVLMAGNAMAASQTWDPGQTGTSDGPGTWDLSTPAWTGGVWVNGNTAIFGNGGSPGTVTIASPGVSAAGVTFNLGYTLNGPGNLTLSGPVTVASGQNATVNAVIAGTSGLAFSGGGSLTLGATNTYTGNTSLDGGTLVYTANNALARLNFGAAAQSANVSNLVLNSANLTATSLVVQTSSATSNTITIGSGHTFTVTGYSQFGTNPTSSTAVPTFTTISGGGSFVVDASAASTNFIVGVGSGNNSFATMNVTLDMTGLTNFSYNTGATGTGQFLVGVGTRPNATLKLATNNTIVAGNVTIGDSAQTPGFSGSNNNNGGTSQFQLGNGTNIINAANITIGRTKGSGVVSWIDTNPTGTGTITIAGQTGGSSTANITIGLGSSGSATGAGSALLLAGHLATVNAATVILGNAANVTGGANSGNITFDTGTFNVNSLSLGVSSGTNSGSANGTFILGTDASSTGVLNVNTAFALINNTNSAASDKANFTINGGTANINANITTSGAGAPVLNLNGGILNMMGHAIGSASSTAITATLGNGPSPATLMNLGGTGINGAGLVMNGTSTLILAGNNTYTGGTAINSGTLQVGSATQTGSLPAGDVADNAALVFAGQGNSTINNLTGSGSLAINAGTVRLANASGFSGSLSLNSGGTFAPGTSAEDVSTAVAIPNLTVNGGTLLFNLDTTTSTSIAATSASFTATPTLAFNLVGSPTSGQQFTILTATTMNDGGFLSSLPVTSVGRTTFTPTEVGGNSIVVTVSGGPASLVWNGAADGTTWNTRVGTSGGTQNWLNGASQDYFFTADNVTFNDANGGHYNVTVSGNVAPGSMKVNTAGTYTFAGSGSIGGAGSLTKDGSGTLVLANTGTNTYGGGTNIHNGTLVIGAPGALPANTALSLGDGTGNSGTLDLGGNNASVSSITEAGGSNVIGSSGSTTATLTLNGGSSNITYNGVIKDVLGAGSGKVALNVASGTLLLGGANTYTGGTTVGATATLTLNAAASLPANTPLTDNGTVNLTGTATSLSSLNGNGTLNLNGNTLTVSNGGAFSGAMADGSAQGSLIASGGNLSLTGLSSYTGTTTIQAGARVQANASSSATTPTNTSLGAASGGNVTIVSGGTLDIGGAAANTLDFGTKVFLVAGTGTDGAGAIVNSGNTTQLSAFNNITLTGDATFSGSRFDFGRNFAGTLDLANHTLTTNMSGAQPIFSILGGTTTTGGQIVVNTGGLDIERTAAIAADGNGSAITFNPGSTLELFQTDGTSLTRPLVFNGNNTVGSGSTTIATLGSNSTLKGNITFEANGSGIPSLTANNPLAVTGTIGESGGSFGITKAGVSTLTLSGANTYSGGTSVTGGTLIVANSAALGKGGLAIHTGGTVQLQSGLPTAPIVTSLTFDGTPGNWTGKLDLTSNKLVVQDAVTHAASLASLASQSRSVITTTSTLPANVVIAVLDNADLHLSTFGGATVDANSILIGPELLGDANADGIVNTADINIVLNHFGASSPAWSSGNFDGAATIDLTDLAFVLNNFNMTNPNPAGVPGGLVATPEPTSLALLGLGAAALLTRRRKA